MAEVKVLKPPSPLRNTEGFRVFLAGSIEMGSAEDWQTYVARRLLEAPDVGGVITVLNPRRDDWDSSWEQSIHHPQFRAQVLWELEAMEKSDMIAMHFEPGTKSPITLLEFGLWARSPKLVVHCPEGFWRKGNVDVVSVYYGVIMVSSIQELVDQILFRASLHYVRR